jgi:hypothetical protein
MRKVIIIDDRVERQKQYLSDKDLQSLSAIDGVVLCYQICMELDSYNDYDLLAFHRSALVERNILSAVVDYCKKNGKYLVTFSGGINNNNFYTDHYIELNSKTFYRIDRLKAFLQDFCQGDGDVHILRLVYGDNWLMPFIVKYNHLRWQYGDAMPQKVADQFYDLEDLIGPELTDDPHKLQQKLEILKNLS